MGWFSSDETAQKYKCGGTGEDMFYCGKRWGEEVSVSELPDKGYWYKRCPECSGSSDYSRFDGGTGAGPSGNSW